MITVAKNFIKVSNLAAFLVFQAAMGASVFAAEAVKQEEKAASASAVAPKVVPPPAAVTSPAAAAAPTQAADKAAPVADKAVPAAPAPKPAGTVVELKTSEGSIKVELADKDAPVSVQNFLSYVNSKFYDGTVFHRVIDGFMIQGGGYTIESEKLLEKPTNAPIANEAKNGLKNDRGTLAMARTSNPDSATAQFFINLVNNDRLNYPSPDGHGYTVFGKVLEGMEVVDRIGRMRTGTKLGMRDVPLADVKIVSAVVVSKGGAH